jgi:chromosome segregation ATPase
LRPIRHVVDVLDEIAVSQRAPEPGRSDQTSYPADVAKLTDWDQKLSVIAEEAIDLQHELSRLQEKSDAVVQLLEQREHELEEKSASLVQLMQERDQTETSTAAANAALSEAQALLQEDRERMASLEQLLELRQAEFERSTALEQELHSLRAHVVELEEREPRPAATPPQPRSHLRLVALPTGYALSETPEPPPQVGELIGIDGKRYAVASSGRSPLPGDERPCVLLLVEPSGTGQGHLPEALEPAADALASL